MNKLIAIILIGVLVFGFGCVNLKQDLDKDCYKEKTTSGKTSCLYLKAKKYAEFGVDKSEICGEIFNLGDVSLGTQCYFEIAAALHSPGTCERLNEKINFLEEEKRKHIIKVCKEIAK